MRAAGRIGRSKMLIEATTIYTREPAFLPALTVAVVMALYLVWNLLGIFGREEKLQSKTIGAILITVVFVLLAIIAWKNR